TSSVPQLAIVAPSSLPPPLFPADWSVADLHRHLGEVSLERTRLYPAPGMAKEEDALRISGRKKAICELIDGASVENNLSTYESCVAATLIYFIAELLQGMPLAIITAGDGDRKTTPCVRVGETACLPATDHLKRDWRSREVQWRLLMRKISAQRLNPAFL